MNAVIMNSTINLEKINSTCRICLKEDVSGVSLFSLQGNILFYCDLIKKYTGLDIVEKENLPNMMCDECGAELRIVDRFISKCRLSHAKLENIYEANFSNLNGDHCFIKEEDNFFIIDIVEGDVKEETNEIFYKKFHSPSSFVDGDEVSFEIETKHPEKNELTDNFSKKQKHLKTNQSKDNINQKTSIKKQWKCMRCKKVTKSESALVAHQRTHGKEKLYKCESCNKSFSHKNTLTKHCQVKHGEENFKTKENKFICDICGKVCKKRYYLRIHLRTHTDEKPFQCQTCFKSFTQSGNLSQHMLSHTGERPFKCATCSKAFISSCSLKRHMIVHSDEKKFKCHICDKLLKSKVGISTHLKTVHMSEKPFLCDICGKAHSLKSNLNFHMKSKHSELSGTCHICNKTVANLPEHMKDHSGERRFLCSLCPKKFSRKMGLTVHLLMHKNKNKFPCTFDACTAAFFKPDHLKFHINKVHHKIHTHICKFCSKGFFRKSDVVNHISQKYCKKLKE